MKKGIAYLIAKQDKKIRDWNRIEKYTMDINSVWVNEMKAGEYNPIHIHQGKLFTGL